jgi:hypothetical protein
MPPTLDGFAGIALSYILAKVDSPPKLIVINVGEHNDLASGLLTGNPINNFTTKWISKSGLNISQRFLLTRPSNSITRRPIYGNLRFSTSTSNLYDDIIIIGWLSIWICQ